MKATSKKKVSIRLTVLQGTGLAAKDRTLLTHHHTTSDPYVEVWAVEDGTGRRGGRKIGKTRTKDKTLEPTWNNERFDIDFPNVTTAAPLVMLKIYDEDTLSEDDLMGIVTVPVAKSGDTTEWYDVSPDSAPHASGKLRLRFETTFHIPKTLVRGNSFALSCSRLAIGLAWDMAREGREIDLDASIVALTEDGLVSMPDTVYYGNTSNPTGSIVHSGDEREGDEAGDDERITVNLDWVPKHVLALYLVLTVATPNVFLDKILSAKVHVTDVREKLVLCTFEPARDSLSHDATAMFLLRIARTTEQVDQSSTAWTLKIIQDSHPTARDFGATLPTLKSYTQDLLPDINVDPTERVAIMRKGGNIRLLDYTQGSTLPELVRLGLSWSVTGGRNIDLDASAVCLDADLNRVDQVWFRQLRSRDGAIRHHGDEMEGDAVGDDEKMDLSLAAVDPSIQYVGFVINSFSGQELDDVSRASCHVFDPSTNTDICSYAMAKASSLNGHTALVLGCFYRGGSTEDSWCLCIIGEAAQGRTVEDNVDELQGRLRRCPPQPPQEEEEEEIVVEGIMPEEVPLQEEEEIDLSIPPTFAT